MQPLRTKFCKICQWTKKIKDAIVYGCGRQIFPKSPKENQNALNMSTARLFKKIDAQCCLQKCFISVYTRIEPCHAASCVTRKRTRKNWSVPIFWGLSD